MTTEGPVSGINKSSLWTAWKAVRIQLRRAPRRDVLDYLEFDIDPDVWINRLLWELKNGAYTPQRPVRYSVAKSNGFDRIITVPAVPDLVLYRTIVDHLFRKAQRKQARHVYFCQATLSKVWKTVEKEAENLIAAGKAADATDYPASARSTFLEWLRFDQYRKFLIFEKVYPFIVVTDITNFFDSVLYGRVEESLYDLPAPPKMVSLLFLLLENLSIREPYVPVQRIGLPVDPCDCSRNLAHMALFPHDRRLVELVGEDAYVRWMDDQNIGVDNRAEGLRVLHAVGVSLRKLHLTPNAGKSKILSLAAARRHFHFASNRRLDKIDKLPDSSLAERVRLRGQLRKAWRRATQLEGVGEWEKVLKRFYRNAARARAAPLLIRRAKADIKATPNLTERITEYLRYTVTVAEYLAFVEDLLADPEQIYPSVSYCLLESLLFLEPAPTDRRRLRRLAQSVLTNEVDFAGRDECKVLVPLFYLRYGDKRNMRAFAARLGETDKTLTPAVERAICAVLAGFGPAEFRLVEKAAGKMLRNHLSEFVRMVHRIREFDDIPGRFKMRIQVSHDSITRAKFVDMRTFIAARLLGLCSHKEVRRWLRQKRDAFLADDISPFDKALLKRIWP
jgi:hypothetical protein